MTFQGWTLIIAFVAILLALTQAGWGCWLFALYEGRRHRCIRCSARFERGFYKLAALTPMPSRAGGDMQCIC